LTTTVQEGIYYRKAPVIGNSFCVISLRAGIGSSISEVGRDMRRIWSHLTHLKKGITADLKIDSKHRKIGNLTALIALGSKTFELPGSRFTRPLDFADKWNFKYPEARRADCILDGSEMYYSPSVIDNHLLDDHIVLQFIADNEFYTSRAAVEVWKALNQIEKETKFSHLRITGIYSGFQRADKRNWFGFHDGVSNLKPSERPRVILIDPRTVGERDKWTANGSYIAFLRIALNLKRWDETTVPTQEMIIGRDKLTGCPLVRLDSNNMPVKDNRCPVPGTTEVIDPGNQYFRDHPAYGRSYLGDVLRRSHIGRTNPVTPIPLTDKRSLRIFRQGFEFLVASPDSPGFVAGLNFVSFQNTPERLYRALTYRPLAHSNIRHTNTTPTLEQFMSVLVGGIFFVPPFDRNEPFPGAQIFFNERELS
jgi:Dyp-type peroxidase family